MSLENPGAPAEALGDDSDPEALIARLRTQGAEHFDPVRFAFIVALARRAASQRDDVKRILQDKLTKLLVDYGAPFEPARATRQAGDSGGLARPVTGLEGPVQGSPLADLLVRLGQLAPEAPDGGSAAERVAPAETPGELKSVKYFRNTWSQLSIDQQLAHALAQLPENAGPLNSHHLALRSLKLMRDTSPAYLKRFMSYIDALFWLDQADSSRNPGKKTAMTASRSGNPL